MQVGKWFLSLWQNSTRQPPTYICRASGSPVTCFTLSRSSLCTWNQKSTGEGHLEPYNRTNIDSRTDFVKQQIWTCPRKFCLQQLITCDIKIVLNVSDILLRERPKKWIKKSFNVPMKHCIALVVINFKLHSY